MTNTNDVTLIQCTDSKRKQPAPARLLYDESSYFRAMREWAEAHDRPWYILSAKHGLVPPERRLGPYDERGISEEQAQRISRELWQQGYDVVHITAGRDYTNHLVPALEGRRIEVVNHFAGDRIQVRENKLKQETRELVNQSL